MARILDLPPELLVKIFATSAHESGRTAESDHGINSAGLYSLAISCKHLYAVFKENEKQIFSSIVKELVKDHAPICDHDLAIKITCLGRLFEVPKFDDDDNRFTRLRKLIGPVNQADASSLASPSVYGAILDYIRRSFHFRDTMTYIDLCMVYHPFLMEISKDQLPAGLQHHNPLVVLWYKNVLLSLVDPWVLGEAPVPRPERCHQPFRELYMSTLNNPSPADGHEHH